MNQETTTGQVGRVPFPRTARLIKPTDFKSVFERNAASNDAFFRIIARPSAQQASRLGLAVSRKVDRRAVGRNRIKRIVRESFRRRRALDAAAGGPALDIVVLARPAAAAADNQRLFSSLDHHWAALSRKVKQRFQGAPGPEGSDKDG
jgi:ribonuclease P protein component